MMAPYTQDHSAIENIHQAQSVVEVFKTNIHDKHSVQLIIQKLREVFPRAAINVDLDDCDKVLRVAFRQGHIDSALIVHLAAEGGFEIEVLE
jgi:hypothetical protein